MGEVVSLQRWKDSKEAAVASRTPDSGPSGCEDPSSAWEGLCHDDLFYVDLSTVEDAIDALHVYEPSSPERFPTWFTVLEPPQLMNDGRPSWSSAPLGPAG